MKKIVIGMISIFLLTVVLLLIFIPNKDINVIETDKESVGNNTLHENEEKKCQYKHFNPSIGNIYDYTYDMSLLNKIYYKKISTYSEYIVYKDRWTDILEMKEEDFENYFMVITVTEGTTMIGLTIGELYNDDNKLYIGLKQFKGLTEYVEGEKGISIIIPNEMKKDEIETFRTVEEYDNLVSEYVDIRSLPKEYSLAQAIEDNCYIYDRNRTL